MNNDRYRIPRAAILLRTFVLGGWMAQIVVQAAGQDAANAAREESLKEMRGMAQGVKVAVRGDGQGRQPVEMLASPLMHYSDQPRQILDATLWCFGEKGRPAAMCKIEKLPGIGEGFRWLNCFASVSSSRIEAEWPEGKKFSSTEAGPKFFDLPDSPAPAESRAARLRQAKELARRFDVSLADPDLMFRENLRLLTQPIHRYADDVAGIGDGLIFVFSTNGTNPDLLVLIEAQGEGENAPQWKAAAVRMTNCELKLRDRERDRWIGPFIRFADKLGQNLDTWMFFFANPQ